MFVICTAHGLPCRIDVTNVLSAPGSVPSPCKKRQFRPTASADVQPVSLLKAAVQWVSGKPGVLMLTTMAACGLQHTNRQQGEHNQWENAYQCLMNSE